MSGKKGYWMAIVDIADAEEYRNYIAANAEVFAKFGAKFIVRAGQFENAEGTAGDRHVVVEFPSYETALACYNSSEYQEALKHRRAASTGRFVIVEGA